VGARDHDGSILRRSVTSCASCLAWGLTYAQGVCLACYNFARPQFDHRIGQCAACRRSERLKQGYCRLCWCQARADRAVLSTDARSAVVLAPYVRDVRHHQLFLADTDRRQAIPRTTPRRYGVMGRPLKPPPVPTGQPVTEWIQPPLFDAGPCTYQYGRIDLRGGAPPENPWLAWALHLAYTTAETCGWAPDVRRRMQRVLVMLLADYREGEQVRVSDFERIAVRRSTNVDYVVEILASMDIVDDDRPAPLEPWLTAKLAPLSPAMRRDLRAWARALRNGSPRTRPRSAHTVRIYVAAVVPAVTDWADRYAHLREITRDDVVAYLDTLRGRPRETTTAALRSLFGWAKRTNIIFRNPTVRIRNPHLAAPIWQPLQPDEVAASIAAATTVQARLFVALAAIHAARPGYIRALHLGGSPSQTTAARSMTSPTEC
jgi:hypothetical protein